MDTITKRPEIICSAFIEKQGKFLLVFCPKFKVWRVPGGHLEWDEKIENGLLRELKEEVGVTFKNPEFLGYGQDHQYHVGKQKETSRLIMYFHVKTNKELTIDPDEAEKSAWVTFDELKQYKNKEGAIDDFFKRNPLLNL